MADIKEEIDALLNKEKNLEIKMLVIVIISICITLAVFMPRIYIKNQIYYNSLDTSRLYRQYIILKEENRELKLKIETTKYDNEKIEP